MLRITGLGCRSPYFARTSARPYLSLTSASARRAARMTSRSPNVRSSASLVGRAEPPIGVGMPVYNGEPYLEGALRSVLSQKGVDFELVIADNCSTDGTEELCRELARTDPRVRYLRGERN